MDTSSASKRIIDRFYRAFQKKDYATMQSFYTDTSTFSDPVFRNLRGEEVKAMWEMLCNRGKDLVIDYEVIFEDDHAGHAKWMATYTFGKTGRKITNYINAEFTFKDGKITNHVDTFDFYRWNQQAFGIIGYLIGWTSMMQNKVRKTAELSLKKFMQNRRRME